MRRSGTAARVASLLALTGAILVPPVAAGSDPGAPRDAGASSATGCTPGAGTDAASFYLVRSRHDADGRLLGYALQLGRYDGARGSVPVPAASFWRAPVRGAVLYRTDDGERSELSLTSIRCRRHLIGSDDVLWDGALDPTGRYVYYVALRRDDRAPRGAWRVPVDRSRLARRVLPPGQSAASEPGDITAGIEVSWSVDRSELVVQTCRAGLCAVQVMDPRSGERSTHRLRVGPLIGVTDDAIVAYGACFDRSPCAIVTHPRRGRLMRTLVTEAYGGVVLTSPQGPAVVYERPGVDAVELRVRSLATAVDRSLMTYPADARSLTDPDGHLFTGAELPPDTLALVTDSGFGATGTHAPLLFRLDERLRLMAVTPRDRS